MSCQLFLGPSGRVWTLILFGSFFATTLIDASESSRAADAGCVVANNRRRAVARRLLFRRGRLCEPSDSTAMAAAPATPVAAPSLPAAKTITSAAIFADALAAARKIEDVGGKAHSLQSLAEAEAEAGHKEQARKIFVEALTFAKQEYLAEWCKTRRRMKPSARLLRHKSKPGYWRMPLRRTR